jgi:hypothetical protein
MRANLEENIYETNEYLDNNPTWHVEDSSWKAGQILKIIQRSNLQPNSICEIGCGLEKYLISCFCK